MLTETLYPFMAMDELSSNWKRLQARMQQDKTHAKTKKSPPGAPPKGVSKHRGLRQSRSKSLRSPPDILQRTLKTSANITDSQSTGRALGSADTSTRRLIDQLNGGLTPGLSPGKYVALDCEMVGIGPRPEAQSMLARASAVDYNGTQLYDSFVVPTEAITDYRTAVSGITPELVREDRGARSFQEVQRDIAALIEGRVLVGHAVGNDLQALLLKHPAAMIRDTSELRKFRALVGGHRPKLRDLAKIVLGLDVQTGSHSSVEDARATMALFRKEKSAFEDTKSSSTHAKAIQARSRKRHSKSKFRLRKAQHI